GELESLLTQAVAPGEAHRRWEPGAVALLVRDHQQNVRASPHGWCQNARMDERPPVWVGHVVLNVSDVSRSVEFWREIGMRPVEQNEHVAVLELRGGTHLVLVPGTPHPGGAPFDLMVDDL